MTKVHHTQLTEDCPAGHLQQGQMEPLAAYNWQLLGRWDMVRRKRRGKRGEEREEGHQPPGDRGRKGNNSPR